MQQYIFGFTLRHQKKKKLLNKIKQNLEVQITFVIKKMLLKTSKYKQLKELNNYKHNLFEKILNNIIKIE